MDVRTQAIINLAAQLLLIIMVSVAVYLAKKRQLGKHCTIIRVAVPLQIISIAIIMLPRMLGYISLGRLGLFFDIEMLIHHGLGLAIIILWVYINLVFMGLIKMRGTVVVAMRITFSLWILTLLLGIHIYTLIWM